MSATVVHGDCLAVMPEMDAESIDAIVCDPPYGLSFMGKAWDHGVPGEPFWREALRVAKPGAYLLACGGTRTYHRLTCAIEDAGWEIRDCLSWLYGSGFPKHGSALKPAWEPIILARKPLGGTVAANVEAHGTGALNIDGCRIGPDVDTRRSKGSNPNASSAFPHSDDAWTPHLSHAGSEAGGRWPANVCLDEDAAALLDAQSGTLTTNAGTARSPHRAGMFGVETQAGRTLSQGDAGGASRFFYCAKASRRERNAGLDGMPLRKSSKMGDGLRSNVGASASGSPGTTESADRRASNHHPTVKPLALMQWLCRLVTPKGGLILDPFTGSGSTGVAAVAEGFRFIGIEQAEEYVTIARARIAAAPLTLDAA
jgi:DNA modification methylase